MTGRHRAAGEPRRNDPGGLLGALAAEPLDHRVTQAITDLTTGWLRAHRRQSATLPEEHRARSLDERPTLPSELPKPIRFR